MGKRWRDLLSPHLNVGRENVLEWKTNKLKTMASKGACRHPWHTYIIEKGQRLHLTVSIQNTAISGSASFKFNHILINSISVCLKQNVNHLQVPGNKLKLLRICNKSGSFFFTRLKSKCFISMLGKGIWQSLRKQ